jgi:hypothetical protein
MGEVPAQEARVKPRVKVLQSRGSVTWPERRIFLRAQRVHLPAADAHERAAVLFRQVRRNSNWPRSGHTAPAIERDRYGGPLARRPQQTLDPADATTPD